MITDEGYEGLLKYDSRTNLQQLKLIGNEISQNYLKNMKNSHGIYFKPNSK